VQLPVVWDSVDSISLLFRKAMVKQASIAPSLASNWGERKIEGWLVDQFDRVLATRERRQALLLANKQNDCAQVQVLPNGVNLEYFLPADEVRREPDTLVISGK
jgi:hypothetical protein